MAVTVGDIALSLRLIPEPTSELDPGQSAILTRLLGVADAFVDLQIPDAPVAIQDESVIRMASYLYDVEPGRGRRDSYSNAWVNSGAGALATLWRPQAASGSEGVLSPRRFVQADLAAGSGDVGTVVVESGTYIGELTTTLSPLDRLNARGDLVDHNNQVVATFSFAVANNVARSVILVTLVAGTYTVRLTGADSSTGARLRLVQLTGPTPPARPADSVGLDALTMAVLDRLIPTEGLTLELLATAVAARLLPTGGADGEFVGNNQGTPEWASAPGGQQITKVYDGDTGTLANNARKNLGITPVNNVLYETVIKGDTLISGGVTGLFLNSLPATDNVTALTQVHSMRFRDNSAGSFYNIAYGRGADGVLDLINTSGSTRIFGTTVEIYAVA